MFLKQEPGISKKWKTQTEAAVKQMDLQQLMTLRDYLLTYKTNKQEQRVQ